MNTQPNGGTTGGLISVKDISINRNIKLDRKPPFWMVQPNGTSGVVGVRTGSFYDQNPSNQQGN